MKNTITIKSEHEISNQFIDDVIATALEGGINYWCGEVKMKIIPDEVNAKLNEIIASDLISLGGVLELHEINVGGIWDLTLSKFLNGLELYIENESISFESLKDDFDANDADLIIQYALFGKIIFG